MIHKGTKKLESDRLILRRMKESDAEEIYNGFINQEEFLYYANKKSRTLEEEKKSLVGIDKKYEKDNYCHRDRADPGDRHSGHFPVLHLCALCRCALRRHRRMAAIVDGTAHDPRGAGQEGNPQGDEKRR